MKSDAQHDATGHSCCDYHHDERAMSVAAVESRQLGKRYFCAMCGGVESDTPDSCPICGMTLEPRTLGAGAEEEQHEASWLSRKFWIALVLTIPVLIFAMGHAI